MPSLEGSLSGFSKIISKINSTDALARSKVENDEGDDRSADKFKVEEFESFAGIF